MVTRLYVAKMINSGNKDRITQCHPRLLKYCKLNNWLTLDNILNDAYGVYIRDNNL